VAARATPGYAGAERLAASCTSGAYVLPPRSQTWAAVVCGALCGPDLGHKTVEESLTRPQIAMGDIADHCSLIAKAESAALR
jgi:hypothetical protein